ncbi:hypothetical protein [Vibrio gallaecicus]|uniref:hypothetical protein n=1 Tax=Vibrio gallaecicus TaxID=552386 RepID=UPI0025B33418|nr:hypothetical protein [Vibrio gallaecicus]MDN3615559.1 hypothetical protein [Vibrio gallaecicus]
MYPYNVLSLSLLIVHPEQPNLHPEDNQFRGVFLFRVSILPTPLILPISKLSAMQKSDNSTDKIVC